MRVELDRDLKCGRIQEPRPACQPGTTGSKQSSF